MGKTKRKPYEERDDLQKIKSQWRKLSGLHTREEWSAAVVRAATAAEIAANLAIREEFAQRSEFKADVVDSFLIWANGLDGKMKRLIFPLLAHRSKDLALMKKLYKGISAVNTKRNTIVHGGHFCNEDEATELIAACKTFVEGVVGIYYEPGFALTKSKANAE